jgi:hypothetical protein
LVEVILSLITGEDQHQVALQFPQYSQPQDPEKADDKSTTNHVEINTACQRMDTDEYKYNHSD